MSTSIIDFEHITTGSSLSDGNTHSTYKYLEQSESYLMSMHKIRQKFPEFRYADNNQLEAIL